MLKIVVLLHPQSKHWPMNESNKNLDPTKVKKWIAVIIAILSAIAGALGESATSFVHNTLFQ